MPRQAIGATQVSRPPYDDGWFYKEVFPGAVDLHELVAFKWQCESSVNQTEVSDKVLCILKVGTSVFRRAQSASHARRRGREIFPSPMSRVPCSSSRKK